MKETPLSRAAHNGHFQMVHYLVEQGADVNCLDLVSITTFILCAAALDRNAAYFVKANMVSAHAFAAASICTHLVAL